MPDTTPRSPQTRADKAIATTIARSFTLLQDGYRIHPVPNRPGVYRWRRPLDRPLAEGEEQEYEAEVLFGGCSCKMYELHGVCKHDLTTHALVGLAVYLLFPILPDHIAKIAERFDLDRIAEALRDADTADCLVRASINSNPDGDYAWSDELLPPPSDTDAPPAATEDSVPAEELPVPLPDTPRAASAYPIPMPPTPRVPSAIFATSEDRRRAIAADFG